MSDQPRIKIISEGSGSTTKILTPDEFGEWIDISNAVSEVDLHLKVGELNTAKIKALLVGAEIDAVVTDLQTKVLPPPLPKTHYRFRVIEGDASANVWRFEKITPLPTYGVKEELICGGVLDKDVPLVEFTGEIED